MIVLPVFGAKIWSNSISSKPNQLEERTISSTDVPNRSGLASRVFTSGPEAMEAKNSVGTVNPLDLPIGCFMKFLIAAILSRPIRMGQPRISPTPPVFPREVILGSPFIRRLPTLHSPTTRLPSVFLRSRSISPALSAPRPMFPLRSLMTTILLSKAFAVY